VSRSRRSERTSRGIRATVIRLVASKRHVSSQAKSRSTVYRCRYSSFRATTGRPRLGRHALGRRLGGIHVAMPRRRRAWRKALPSYPRLATSSLGRCRPRPCGRATRMVSSVCSANLASAQLALSRRKPEGRPFASVTSIQLVPLPFLVRPTCSPPSWQARTSHRGRPCSNPALRSGRVQQAPLARYAPRPLPLPSA
jgi:hypothetical protein